MTTTDKDGFYRIPGLFAGVDSVEAVKEGYVRSKSSVSITGGTRFDITVVRDPVRLEGAAN